MSYSTQEVKDKLKSITGYDIGTLNNVINKLTSASSKLASFSEPTISGVFENLKGYVAEVVETIPGILSKTKSEIQANINDLNSIYSKLDTAYNNAIKAAGVIASLGNPEQYIYDKNTSTPRLNPDYKKLVDNKSIYNTNMNNMDSLASKLSEI